MPKQTIKGTSKIMKQSKAKLSDATEDQSQSKAKIDFASSNHNSYSKTPKLTVTYDRKITCVST